MNFINFYKHICIRNWSYRVTFTCKILVGTISPVPQRFEWCCIFIYFFCTFACKSNAIIVPVDWWIFFKLNNRFSFLTLPTTLNFHKLIITLKGLSSTIAESTARGSIFANKPQVALKISPPRNYWIDQIVNGLLGISRINFGHLLRFIRLNEFYCTILYTWCYLERIVEKGFDSF